MTVKIRRKSEKTISIIELLFQAMIMSLAIFNPPVLNFNTIHIIAFFSWMYIVFHLQWLNSYLYLRRIAVLYVCLTLLGVYQFLIAFLSGYSIIIASNYVFWLLEVIPYCIGITLYYSKNNWGINEFINTICLACFIQSVLAVLALIFSPVKAFFIRRLISYGYAGVHERLSLFRDYGLADALSFTSSIVQAIIATISLFFYIKTKKIVYLVVFSFGAFASVINTRSSIIILFAGVLCIGLSTRELKAIFRGVRTMLIIIIVASIAMNILKIFNDWTYSWVMTGAKEILAFLSGNKDNYGYFNYILAPEHLVLPKGLRFLFGYGIEVMHGYYFNVQTDIGYINDIWRIGFLATIVIYSLYFIAINKFKHSKIIDKSTGLFLHLLFLFSAILVNVKGYYFVYNNITTLFWIMFIFCCCTKNGYRISDNTDTKYLASLIPS